MIADVFLQLSLVSLNVMKNF